MVFFQQIDQALFNHAGFVVARVSPEIMLVQMLRDAGIADVRAIDPMVDQHLEAVSVGESACETDFVDATGLGQSSVNIENYEFH
jgi:hypothetical protein